ncbi:predicted protein [Naegleria gruberi]|uniref:Predicted protein n=1 Tax=Naegleria gruberi TaxID=5762 RepID=D2VRV8_NAEGR|nr:uncharacterized protein NAEGRDRAFT_71720 [Naegleria gruberi]EFC40455.1 predicted protein [Naegleria gruberi]|eukprot:XP_002673199.1 predicted protein [Naegleria gruberi strain NEG-M]
MKEPKLNEYITVPLVFICCSSSSESSSPLNYYFLEKEFNGKRNDHVSYAICLRKRLYFWEDEFDQGMIINMKVQLIKLLTIQQHDYGKFEKFNFEELTLK